MDGPVRVGIVGCGGIAQVIHLPILKKHPLVKILAICDIDVSKAAVIADKFEIKNVYQDIADLLKKEQLHVVFILTPTNLHLPMSLMALEYGVHLFIEKPVAPTTSDAIRIQTKAKKVQKSVMVGMQNRFRTDVIALKKLLLAKDLGKLFFLSGKWLQAKHQGDKQPWLLQKNVSGGGVILDLGVQLLDLVWWLLEKPQPVSIKGFSYTMNQELQVEDFCVGCVSFSDNIAFSLELSWDFPIKKDIFSLEVIGEKGTGTLNPLKLQRLWHGQLVNITPELDEDKAKIFKRGYENEINHFINFILGAESQLDSSIEDAVQVSKMIEALYKSSALKKEVYLNE
jgi:predicted dehydrogenase